VGELLLDRRHDPSLLVQRRQRYTEHPEIFLRQVLDRAARDVRLERVGLRKPHERVEQVLRDDPAARTNSMQCLLVADPPELPPPDSGPAYLPAFADK